MKTLKMWWRRSFFNLTYKLIGIDVGPIMFQFHGNYYYLDAYSNLWKLRPTMDPDNPFTIEWYWRR